MLLPCCDGKAVVGVEGEGAPCSSDCMCEACEGERAVLAEALEVDEEFDFTSVNDGDDYDDEVADRAHDLRGES